MGTHEIIENREGIYGMLPFTDRVFEKLEIKSCCRERSSWTAPAGKPSPALLSATESARSHPMGEDATADWSDRSLDELTVADINHHLTWSTDPL